VARIAELFDTTRQNCIPVAEISRHADRESFKDKLGELRANKVTGEVELSILALTGIHGNISGESSSEPRNLMNCGRSTLRNYSRCMRRSTSSWYALTITASSW